MSEPLDSTAQNTNPVLDYSRYLKVNELLSLQKPSNEHDELLFIVIHQTYELWFKEMLHEIDHLCELFRKGAVDGALKTSWRIMNILRILVMQFDILETMTPIEFMTFRPHLGSSSGMESYQFRELEFIFGLKANFQKVITYFSTNPTAEHLLKKRYTQSTVWDAFLYCLAQQGYSVPQALLNRDVTQSNVSSPEVQKILIDVYLHHPQLRQVCEHLIDLDESMLKWRYHHILMVQRTIGANMGTGGSEGAKYLMSTLTKPFFPDLWDFRSHLKLEYVSNESSFS